MNGNYFAVIKNEADGKFVQNFGDYQSSDTINDDTISSETDSIGFDFKTKIETMLFYHLKEIFGITVDSEQNLIKLEPDSSIEPWINGEFRVYRYRFLEKRYVPNGDVIDVKKIMRKRLDEFLNNLDLFTGNNFLIKDIVNGGITGRYFTLKNINVNPGNIPGLIRGEDLNFIHYYCPKMEFNHKDDEMMWNLSTNLNDLNEIDPKPIMKAYEKARSLIFDEEI